jgi:hypothetical protein
VTDTSEIGTYRRLFDEKYAELDALLDGLPAAALLWQPFEQSPWQGPSAPLGKIVAHAVSSTVYLLRRAEWVMGRIEEWKQVDGDEGREEFGPANHDPAYLRARVRRSQEFVHAFLAGLGAGDLDAARPHPRRPELVFTVRYDVQHAVEHLSQHIGHAQITRQLWELEKIGD